MNVSTKSKARHGEVAEWSPEKEDAEVLAPSLSSSLQQLADGLERGTIVYQRENGLVHVRPATVEQMPKGVPSPAQIQKLLKMKVATCPVCGRGMQGVVMGLHLERAHGIR